MSDTEEFLPLEHLDSDDSDEEEDIRGNALFMKDGTPVGFYFHKSIKHEDQREKLRQDIETHGGEVHDTDEDVDTVLFDPNRVKKLVLQTSYNADALASRRKVFAEPMGFVQHCITYRNFEHLLAPVKGMGGRLGIRRNFTSDDDYHLCEYLARNLPYKEQGGRLGLAVYQTLVEMPDVRDDGAYDWAKRHTAESWKQRYKTHAREFDPIISDIARKSPPTKKQLWREDRRASQGMYGRMYRNAVDEDEDEEGEEFNLNSEVMRMRKHFQQEEEEEEEEEEEAIAAAQRKRKRSGQDVRPVQAAKRAKRPERQPEVYGTSPAQSAKKKGKEKAFESEQGNGQRESPLFIPDEDIRLENLGTFELDEPGPSNVNMAQSPERTLAEPASRNRRPPSPPDFFPTQETLVDIPSAPRRTSGFDPISHSTSANRQHSANTTRSQVPSRKTIKQDRHPAPTAPPVQQPRRTKIEPVVIDLTLPDEPAPRAQPQPETLSSRSNRAGPAPPSSAPQQPPAPSQRPIPRKAARRPPNMMVSPTEAPYRNTRSRSRSVEPTVLPKKKKKPNMKKDIILEEEEEATAPIAEILEEEMDVKNFLTSEDANHSIDSAKQRVREASLDTDDGRTKHDLLREFNIPRPAKTYTSKKVQPSDVLRELAPSTSSAPRDFQLSGLQRPPHSGKAPLAKDEPRQTRPARRGAPPSSGTSKIPEPRTPMPRDLRGSESSIESFPVSGTRASEVKKIWQEQEKHSPYRPPQGTRAAQAAALR